MRKALIFVLLVACSDPARNSIDASTGGTIDASVIDTSIATADAPMDALPANCPAGQFCFHVNKVVPAATIPNGRIVVVFYQINDDLDPAPPLAVMLDRPFVGSSTMIELPLADIVLPAPLGHYQMCPRACGDLTMALCDCMAAEAKVALAFVFVVRDADLSGTIEAGELVDANMYGVGYMHLGAAPMAYPNPQMLQFLLPEGIVNGVAPYEIIEAGTFDDLGIPPPGQVFILDVCVPGDASCDLVRFPNLT